MSTHTSEASTSRKPKNGLILVSRDYVNAASKPARYAVLDLSTAEA